MFLFHTHIATPLACHTRSLKYIFYMLIAKLLPSQSTFMDLEYKNVYTYFLAFTATLPVYTSLHLPTFQPLPHTTTQDQKPLFSIQATSWKFSNIHHLSKRFALTHAE